MGAGAVLNIVVATGASASAGPTPLRAVPTPLFGVTVDNVTNLGDIVASSAKLPAMPMTRVYFNVRSPASSYVAAVEDPPSGELHHG